MLYRNSTIVKKKQRGQFFTNPTIARQIVDEICGKITIEYFWKPLESLGNSIDQSEIINLLDRIFRLRIVDPAMGDGVFLLEVIHFFEEFIIKLWEKSSSVPYQVIISNYFKQKLTLDFSLVGNRDKLTFDIWKLHIIRSIIYGVDLDPKIVQKARNRIIEEIKTPRIKELANSLVQSNFRVGNSLISPIRMNIKAKDDLCSNYHSEIEILLSQRKKIQNIHWNELSTKKINELLEENEIQRKKLTKTLLNKIKSFSFFSFLFEESIQNLTSFLWEIEFPEVFFYKEYGFNAVIGNPPWDKWKLYDREWLGSTAISKTDHSQKVSIIQRNDVEAHSKYLKLKKFYKNTTQYFNEYFNWQPGEKNLFKLFLERFYTLCSFNGFMGVILPGGILGEYYSEPLRKVLLTKVHIQIMIEIISNKEIFPDAEPGLSILIILTQKGKESKNFPFIKGISSIKSLTKINTQKLSNNSDNLIYFTQKDIITNSPKSIIPAVRNQLELQIIRKMTKFPSLSSNKWGCKTSRGIDMTNDRDLLVNYVTPYPLVEGRHLVRLGFDNTHPRYWINSFSEYQNKIPFWNQDIIVWKNFSGNHRRRRMRIAILPPKTVISNSVICLYNFPNITNVEFYLAGIMCSIPFEFRIRQVCYGININQYIVDSITVPIFDPSIDYHQRMVTMVREFIPKGYKWARRKMESSSSLKKAQLEYDYQDTITAIDALSALIYKLSKTEFQATLNAHPLLEELYHIKALRYYDSFTQSDLI